MILSEYNDYELVSLAQEGNEDAINLIYKKYKPVIVKKSHDAIYRANHHGIEISDIMQEGYIGLEDAINKFSESDNTCFYTFANLCIEREIINYLRKTTRGRNRILNDAGPIDECLEMTVKDDYDTEFSIIYEETKNSIIDKIEKEFTDFEKDVFKYKIDGYSIEEIANTLNRDLKSIYNTIHRIKSKFRKFIDEDDYL